MTIQDLIEIFQKYKKLILTIVGLIVVLLLLSYTFIKVDQYFQNREIEKSKKEINALNSNIKEIEGNLFNLNIDNRLQEEEVNRLSNNYNDARNQTNDARNQTNKSLDNINKLNNKNFNNSNLTEAERNRCIAYNRGC